MGFNLGSMLGAAGGFIPGVAPWIGGASALIELLGNQGGGDYYSQMQRLLDEDQRRQAQEYADLVSGNNRTLMGTTGVLGDALRALGSNLGAAMAAGGVTNSSATAGAIESQRRGDATTIADTALRNRMGEQNMLRQNRQSNMGSRLNLLGTQAARADQQQANTGAGIQSWLGTLQQQASRRAGAKAPNASGPPGIGMMNSAIMPIDRNFARPLPRTPLRLGSSMPLGWRT